MISYNLYVMNYSLIQNPSVHQKNCSRTSNLFKNSGRGCICIRSCTFPLIGLMRAPFIRTYRYLECLKCSCPRLTVIILRAYPSKSWRFCLRREQGQKLKRGFDRFSLFLYLRHDTNPVGTKYILDREASTVITVQLH